MKIKERSWAKDNHNDNIYYFGEIDNNYVKTIMFQRQGRIEMGLMDLDDWKSFIGKIDSKRLTDNVNLNNVSRNRKLNMISNLFFKE